MAALNNKQKKFVQRMAIMTPEALDEQEQRVLLYYRCARRLKRNVAEWWIDKPRSSRRDTPHRYDRSIFRVIDGGRP